MQTLSYSHPQKPKVSLPMVAAVGALHVGFIYALLVGLEVIPAPAFVPHTDFKFIPDKTPVRPKTPDPAPTIPKHIDVFVPVPPPIPTDNSQSNDHGIKTVIGTGPTIAQPIPPTGASALASTHTTPDYPSMDRLLGHQGAVKLALVIDEQGNVTDASVVQSSGYDGLDQAAIAWVKTHWRYHPATRDGKPVASRTQAQVTFRLTQG